MTASPQPSGSRPAGPAAGRTCSAALRTLAAFGALTVVLSLLFSLIATPFVHLEWWRVFRRCASIAAFASLWWLTRIQAHRPLASYGLAASREGTAQLRFGALLGACGLAVLFGIGLATGASHIDVTDDRVRLWRTVLGFIPAALLVAGLEELIFRGLILQQLLACSRTAAIIVSSGLYALVHLKSPSMSLLTWMELGGLFLLGVVLSVSYLVTGRLWLAVGLHGTLAYGARVNKLVLSFSDPSMAWLTGTSRLVNGLAGWIALAVIGGIVWRWARRQEGGIVHGT